MSSVSSLLGLGLDELITINPGTLTYNGQSVTVFKSFLRNQTRDMQENGFEQMFDDLYVLAKPSDIASWSLVPSHTQVTLDSVVYIVGRTVTTTTGYVTIWLRIKR